MSRKKRFEDEYLLEHLNELALKLDKTPTYRDMESSGDHCASTYIRRFGSWNDAVEQAGLEPNKRGGVGISTGVVPKTDLIEEMQRVANLLDETPTHEQINKYADYGHSTYLRAFGSWSNAVEQSGLEERKRKNAMRKSDDVLLKDLKQLGEELGYPPRLRDMREKGEHGTGAYIRAFGGWRKALQEAGFEDPGLGQRGGQLHHNWKGGGRKWYGPNWNKKRKQAIDRDAEQCVICGIGRDEHYSEYETDLHVHHITPLRRFENYEDANALGNLMTLCISCHGTWESIPVVPEIS